MNKKKIKNIVMAGVLVVAIAVSGAFAYLTANDSATNTFTMGNVDIELHEDVWNALADENENDIPDVAEHLESTKIITKDPAVENIGANDAYIYLAVEVPKQSVITTDAEGNLLNDGAPTVTELFSYAPDTNAENGHWTLYGSNTAGTNSNVYLYYYNTTVAPGATTETLFDTITFANVIENQITVDTEMVVNVKAYAIQSNTGDGTDNNTAVEAWGIYATQNAGETLPVFTPVAP